VEIKKIGLKGEKVSERVEGLTRLIRMKRKNSLHLKTHYCPELSRGGMIERYVFVDIRYVFVSRTITIKQFGQNHFPLPGSKLTRFTIYQKYQKNIKPLPK